MAQLGPARYVCLAHRNGGCDTEGDGRRAEFITSSGVRREQEHGSSKGSSCPSLFRIRVQARAPIAVVTMIPRVDRAVNENRVASVGIDQHVGLEKYGEHPGAWRHGNSGSEVPWSHFRPEMKARINRRVSVEGWATILVSDPLGRVSITTTSNSRAWPRVPYQEIRPSADALPYPTLPSSASSISVGILNPSAHRHSLLF